LPKAVKVKPAPSLSKDAVLAHFAAYPSATKRDLAKALGVRGAQRQELKQILNELADEGLIQRGRKKSFSKPGALPSVTVLEITGARMQARH
jgi:ribonuclease R